MDILSIVVVTIAVLIAVIFLVFKIKKLGLRQVAINFIVLAEEKGLVEKLTGSEKFNYVFDSIYNLLPKILKCFITKKIVVDFIQKVFEEIKIALDFQNVDVK